MTTVEIWASAVWSVVGLVIGYSLGRYHSKIKGMRLAAADLPSPRPTPPVGTRPMRPRREGPGAATAPPESIPPPEDTAPAVASDKPTWDAWRTVLGLVILVLVAGTTYGLIRTTSCQAGYNAAVTRAISARAERSEVQLQKQIEQLQAQLVLLTPWDGDKTDIQAQRAEGERRGNIYRNSVQANLDALVAARDARTANPIPAADSCGEPLQR